MYGVGSFEVFLEKNKIVPCVGWSHTQTIHVWYINLHLPQKQAIHVGKYTCPMDDMGYFMTP